MATYSSIFILLYLFVCFDYCGSLLLLGFFSSWSERELLFIVGSSLQWLLLLQRWALGLKGSVAVVPGLLNTGSVVVAHRLSCSMASGIFPNEESNLGLLHWQVDSLPLSHQGSPPTPVFLPGEFCGQRSLAGYIQSMGSQRAR